jgi:O-antigen/teichoic acid export membrane protein
MTTTRRKIASNILFLGGSQGITWILNSIYVLVIPRYLGPEGIGTLGLMMAISSIIYVIANMGTRLFLLREIARDRESVKHLIGPTVILNFLLALLCWAVVAIVINATHESENTRLVMYIFGIANILFVSISPLQAALQGLEKMHYSLYETLIQKGAGTILALALAALNFGIILVAMVELVTTVPLVILYFWWYRQHGKITFRGGFEVYRQLIKNGISFFIVEISFNVYLYLDAILLSTFTSEKVVGYYNVPTRLFGALMIIPLVVSRAILPTLSRLAVNTADQMQDMSRKTLSFLICVSLPVAVGSTVMAKPIINFFYGSEFAPSIPIMIILGWTVLPTYLGIGLFQILTAQDKQSQWTKLMVMAVFVNFGLNIGLIQYFQNNGGNGGTGAALSLFITEVIIGIFGLRMVGREVANWQFALEALKSLAAAALMGAIIWPMREAPLFIPIIVGMIVYGIGVVAFGLVPMAYLRAAFGLAGRLKQKFITR